MNTKTKKLLKSPIAEWPQLVSSTAAAAAAPNDLQETESELSALIQRATLLETYISHRYNTGCGDQGHDKSAKIANKTLTKVRKALGFAYPDRLGISM
jgi:hypothetical protein